MIWSWIWAAVILAVAGLAGRAVTRLGGAERWTGLEPATGFAAIVVTGSVLARIDPDRSLLLLGMVALVVLSAAVLRQPDRADLPAVPPGLVISLGVVFLLMCVPFIANGHWGIPGVPGGGMLTEGIESNSPDPGEAGWVIFTWLSPGGILGESVSTGLLMACGLALAWTGWTATDRLAGWRRPLATILLAAPYLVVSAYSAGFFRVMAASLFLLGFVAAVDRSMRTPGSARAGAPLLAPALLTAGTITAFLLVGDVYGLIAGRMTGPVSPLETLGVWLNPDYRLDGDHTTPLPGLLGAVGILALLLSLWWWFREPRSAWPAAVPAGGAVYLIALLFAGDDVPGQVLTVISPVLITVITVALLTGPRSGWKPNQGMEYGGWVSLTALFVVGAIASTFVVLRDATVTPPPKAAATRPAPPDQPPLPRVDEG